MTGAVLGCHGWGWVPVRGRVGQVGAMRACVHCLRIYCKAPSRYLLGRSRLYLELTSFAGNRVWAPEVGCRGVLWVTL